MTTTRTAVLLAAAALALAGCTPGGGTPEPSAAAEASTSAEADGTAAPDATVAPAGDREGSPGASGAEVGEIDPDDVLVSQEVPIPGSSEDTLTIGVLSLVVEGDVQVLRLAVTPHLADAAPDQAISLYEMLGRGLFVPTLQDRVNLKVYSPLYEGDHWASDENEAEATDGQTIELWAVFAAPEDDIDTVDVHILDGWPMFTDVPVTR